METTRVALRTSGRGPVETVARILQRDLRIVVLLIAVAALAACTSAPAPTSTPTPAVLSTATTNPSPTALPPTSTVPATATASPSPTATLSPTATDSPTTAPSPEEIETATGEDDAKVRESNTMNIQIGETVLTATLVENSSADALRDALAEGPLTVNMRDYGNMEKVGSLGMDLPRNDQQITTEAGDLILFQGNAFVIYYAPNSWNFTRLGKIDSVSAEELRGILGDGDVTVTLSLPQE